MLYLEISVYLIARCTPLIKFLAAPMIYISIICFLNGFGHGHTITSLNGLELNPFI
jgi:hypothetical protein